MKLELVDRLVGTGNTQARVRFAKKAADDLTLTERKLFLHIAEHDTGGGYEATVERLCFLVGMDGEQGHLALARLVELGLVVKDNTNKRVIHLVTTKQARVAHVNFTNTDTAHEGEIADLGEGKVQITLTPQGTKPFSGMPMSYERATLTELEVVPIHTVHSFTQEAVSGDSGIEHWACTMIVAAAPESAPARSIMGRRPVLLRKNRQRPL